MAYCIYPPHEERPYFTTNDVIALDCRRWGWAVYECTPLNVFAVQDEEQSSDLGPQRLPLAVRWDQERRRRQGEGELDHYTSQDSSVTGRPQSPRRSIYTSHWYGYEQHNRNAERRRAREATMLEAGATDSITAVLEEEGVHLNSRVRRALARIQHAISHGEELASLHQQASRDGDDEDDAEQLPPYSQGEDAPPYDP